MKKLPLLLCVLFIACHELLTVPDISHEEIVLSQPQENTSYTDASLLFRWEGLDNTSSYRFQLYYLEETLGQSLLRDTLLVETQFRDSLSKNGRYRWQVRGENSAYTTNYSSAAFLLNAPHISNSPLTLISPNNGVDITNASPLFAWDGPLAIQHYRFQLAQPTFEAALELERDTLVANNNLRLTLKTAGPYTWRVRGESADGHTAYSEHSFHLLNPLAQSTPTLIVPMQNAVVNEHSTRFEWQPMEHANEYRIQIVSPDFGVPHTLVLDSLLTNPRLDVVLPNKHAFQWRVSGKNDLGTSGYRTQSFSRVDPLESATLQLVFPQNQQQLDAPEVHFQWEALPLAEEYQIQIVRPNFAAIEHYVEDRVVQETNFSILLEDQQQYSWRVRGISATASTAFASATFSIATQNNLASETIVLLAPSNNAVLTATNVNFNWASLPDADSYHIQVATPGFANATQILLDQVTTATLSSASLAASTTYEWRVMARNNHSSTPYTAAKFRIE